MKAQGMTERSIHITVADWIRWQEISHPILKYIWHTPNGEIRSKKTATLLVRMLVRRGVPDLISPIPRGDWMGLAIELKRPGEKATKDQVRMLEALANVGWQTHIEDSAERAINIIIDYFNLEIKPMKVVVIK